jgi:HEAT repeat protein
MLSHQMGNLCLVVFNNNDLPLLIKIAVIVIMIALCIIFFTLIVINYNRNKTFIEAQEAQQAETLILNELNAHFLNYDSISDMPENELQKTVGNLIKLKNRSAISRQVLVNLLVYFKHNLTGNITRIITSVYYQLNLSETTLSKLKSIFWVTKAQGLKELQAINNSQSADTVIELLGDKHVSVRVEAYSALIKLQHKATFSFLSNEKQELSEWHQILLFDAIIKTRLPETADFKDFLSSTNCSLITLSIKLILYYKQFEAIPELIKLLTHPNEIIRHDAICALGELDAHAAEEKLIEIYAKEHNKNKARILITIGEIASGKGINFIMDKFLKADHYTILKSAAAAIMAHPENLRTEILNNLTNLDAEQAAIIKHFEDPLIRAHGIH